VHLVSGPTATALAVLIVLLAAVVGPGPIGTVAAEPECYDVDPEFPAASREYPAYMLT